MQDVTSAPWNAMVIFIFSVYQEGSKAFLLRITYNTPVNGKMVLFYSKKFSTQNKTWKFHCFTLMLSTDQCMSKQCMNFEFLWNNKTTNVSIVLTTITDFLKSNSSCRCVWCKLPIFIWNGSLLTRFLWKSSGKQITADGLWCKFHGFF